MSKKIQEKKVANAVIKIWVETIQNVIREDMLESVMNHTPLQSPENYELGIPGEAPKTLFLPLSEIFLLIDEICADEGVFLDPVCSFCWYTPYKVDENHV